MTMTLEKIQGMNIPVGAPIEITINSEMSMGIVKGPNNKMYKELGYYGRIAEIIDEDGLKVPILLYNRATGTMKHPEEPMKRGIETSSIEDIKILEYKKSIRGF